jgi:hypothetical protein
MFTDSLHAKRRFEVVLAARHPLPSAPLNHAESSGGVSTLPTLSTQTSSDTIAGGRGPGAGAEDIDGHEPTVTALKLVPISPESFQRYTRRRTMYMHNLRFPHIRTAELNSVHSATPNTLSPRFPGRSRGTTHLHRHVCVHLTLRDL